MVGALDRFGGDAQVRHHRAGLLRQAGLVEAADVLAVEGGRGAEDLRHGDHAGATDTGHADGGVVGGHQQGGGGQRGHVDGRLASSAATRLVGLRRFGRGLLGHHGEERGAVPGEAGVVLVARGLVDLGLAAELGLDRLHRQAVGLHAAVAAAFAHPLVDDDSLGRLDHDAALAVTPLLRRALLIVDQHGGACHLGQHLLRLDDALAVPHLDPVGELDALVLVAVVGGDDDLGHALGQQPLGQLGDGHGAGRILAAGHGHRAVVEDLVGDVGLGRISGADAQRTGVGEGAVAEVLGEVLDVDERLDADPLHALAAHLGVAHELAHPVGIHERDQAMAADARADQLALGNLGAGGVGATGAEVRGAGGQQIDLLAHGLGGDGGQPLGVDALQEAAAQRLDEVVGVEGAVAGDELVALGGRTCPPPGGRRACRRGRRAGGSR